MTTAVKVKGLHAKLAEIRGALNGEIRKTGEHTQGGPKYKFVEALEVGRQFVEKASELGITMIPETMSIVDIRQTTSKSGWWIFTVLVDWLVTDSETGEAVHVQSIGQGADAGDKGGPKAQTNAMKYAILMLLQAAGDDPEKDEPEAPYRAAARRTGTRRKANRADAEAADDPTTEDERFDGHQATEDAPRRRRPRRQEPEPKPGVAMASQALKAKIRARQHEVGLDDEQFRALGHFFTGKTSSTEWTESDAEKVLAKLDLESTIEMFSEVKGIHKEERP